MEKIILKTFIILIVSIVLSTPVFSQQKTITLGIGATSTAYLPVYVAVEKNLFAEEGLNVKAARFKSTTEVMMAVISGDVYIGVGTLFELLNAKDAGQDVKMFWGVANSMAYEIWAKPAIKSIKDTKGKTFGISKFGSVADFTTRYALKHFNIDPEKDVKILQIGNITARYAALKSGAIDATLLDPPLTEMAKTEGYTRLVKVSDVMSDGQYELFARGDILQKDSETVKKFARAIQKAVVFTKKNPEETVKILMNTIGYKEADAKVGYQAFVPFFPEDGKIDLKNIQQTVEFVFSSGEIKKKYSVEELIDSSIMKGLAK